MRKIIKKKKNNERKRKTNNVNNGKRIVNSIKKEKRNTLKFRIEIDECNRHSNNDSI